MEVFVRATPQFQHDRKKEFGLGDLGLDAPGMGVVECTFLGTIIYLKT